MSERLSSVFGRPPVMLLASLPEEHEERVGPERSLEIEEAVLSFGRAAFSRGHPVAVPVDGFVAPLLATVAAEYRPPPRSEASEEAPPQLAIGLIGNEEGELGEWLRRARPDGVLSGRFYSFVDFLELAEPRKVIVVGGGGEAGADRVEQVRERGVELRVLGPTLTGTARERGWETWDAAGELLREIDWPDRRADRGEDFGGDPPPLGAEGLVPYAYLMQRLLETDEEEGVPMVEEDLYGKR